jgi:hypothetical protein
MSSVFEPLFDEDAQLGPVSLRASVPMIAMRIVPVLAIYVFVAFVYGRWLVLVGIGIGLLLVVAAIHRRIDVDQDGLTFVPLLPIVPMQHVPFAAMGPFTSTSPAGARGVSDYLRAELAPGMSLRACGLFPVAHVSVGSGYGRASYTAEPLSLPELQTLLERYRVAAGGREF